MIAPLKFLAGFLSNALTQSVRSMWNAASFLARLTTAIICFALSALQFAAGGSERSTKTFRLALSALKTSLKCGATALVQAIGVLTCASPLMRAGQACSEGISPKGILIPCGSDRNLMQRILGLNSWEEAPVEPPPREIKPVASKETTMIAPKEKPKKTSTNTQAKPEKKSKGTDDEAASWEGLANRYLEARSIDEADRIRNRMAAEHTTRYLKALAAARKPRPRRAA